MSNILVIKHGSLGDLIQANGAIKDIKEASVNISITSVENLLKNSVDKNKLDKIYQDSIEETKLALKQKSS